MKKVLTQDEWLSMSRAAHGERYDYSMAVYSRAKALVEIICKTHGMFTQAAFAHAHGRGCPSCGAELAPKMAKARSNAAAKQFEAKARSVHGDAYQYHLVDYKSAISHVVIVCPLHGEFKQTPNNHLRNHGCPKCGVERTVVERKTVATTTFAALSRDGYDYSRVRYVSPKIPVEIICSTHGSFWQTPDGHAHGRGCPSCGQCCGGGPSDAEDEIAEWVSAQGCVVQRNRRKIIPPREIDIWMPEQKVGIEYHGLYWHTEDKVKNMHEEKARLAEAAGIRLIQVYEDEWSTKKEAVKMVIRNALNIGGDRVMARKCRIVDVDKSVAKEFLDLNHVQGACRARLFIGLEFDGKLVAVMAFNGAVSGRGGYSAGTWELARYATSCTVAGGASRLLAEFDRRHPEAPLVSYVDHRYFVGGMYATLGFTKVRTQVDYEYLFRKKRCHKSTLKKSNLKKLLGDRYDDALTERVMADMLGAKRILNAGRTTYVRA